MMEGTQLICSTTSVHIVREDTIPAHFHTSAAARELRQPGISSELLVQYCKKVVAKIVHRKLPLEYDACAIRRLMRGSP